MLPVVAGSSLAGAPLPRGAGLLRAGAGLLVGPGLLPGPNVTGAGGAKSNEIEVVLPGGGGGMLTNRLGESDGKARISNVEPTKLGA
jgi:hypothetical protein